MELIQMNDSYDWSCVGLCGKCVCCFVREVCGSVWEVCVLLCGLKGSVWVRVRIQMSCLVR